MLHIGHDPVARPSTPSTASGLQSGLQQQLKALKARTAELTQVAADRRREVAEAESRQRALEDAIVQSPEKLQAALAERERRLEDEKAALVAVRGAGEGGLDMGTGTAMGHPGTPARACCDMAVAATWLADVSMRHGSSFHAKWVAMGLRHVTHRQCCCSVVANPSSLLINAGRAPPPGAPGAPGRPAASRPGGAGHDAGA